MLQLKIKKKITVNFVDDMFVYDTSISTTAFNFSRNQEEVRVITSGYDTMSGDILGLVETGKLYKVSVKLYDNVYGNPVDPDDDGKLIISSDGDINYSTFAFNKYKESAPPYLDDNTLSKTFTATSNLLHWEIKTNDSASLMDASLVSISIEEIVYSDLELLDAENGIQLTKSIKEIKDPRKYKINYSNNFDVVLTGDSNQYFGFNNLLSNSTIEYRAKIEDNGFSIMDGIAKFSEIEDKSIEGIDTIKCSIYQSGSDFFKKLKHKELKSLGDDVEFVGNRGSNITYNHMVSTMNPPAVNKTNGKNFYYGLMNNGSLFNNGIFTQDRGVNERIVDGVKSNAHECSYSMSDVYPSTYVHRIWSEIHRQADVTFSGDFFDTDNWNGLLFNYWKDFIKSSEELELLKASGDVNESNTTGSENESKEESSIGLEEVVVVEPESILIWSYTDEILKEIVAFEELYNASVTVEVMDINGLVPMAAGVIRSGMTMPDVLILEEAQISNPQLALLLSDLEVFSTESGLINTISPYSIEKGRSSEGKLIGLSYQVSPVGIYYRRSMAIKAFGTDDPAIIGEIFSSYSNIDEGLDLLNQSNIKMFADIFTLRKFSNLNNQWIDEAGFFDKTNISRDFFELIKKTQFEKQVAFATEWSDEWLNGMYKSITNSYGEDMKVFAYILPSWALSNILMLTGEIEEPILANEDGSIQVFNETIGDWGVTSLANPISSGSSYMTINATSEHMDLSISFLEYMLNNTLHEGTWLRTGDMVSSIPTIQIHQEFPEGDQFLGGQSYHEAMGDIGQKIIAHVYEDVDKEAKNSIIQSYFDDIIIRFIQGDFHTIDEAIKVFVEQVEELYPELFVVVTPE
jgi:hypothetical protein